MRNQLVLAVAELHEVLQKAQASELGPKAPLYALIGNDLHYVTVQVNHKGELGPGSILLLLTKVKL